MICACWRHRPKHKMAREAVQQAVPRSEADGVPEAQDRISSTSFDVFDDIRGCPAFLDTQSRRHK